MKPIFRKKVTIENSDSEDIDLNKKFDKINLKSINLTEKIEDSKKEYLKMSSTGIKLKKDGTPDLRFKNAKSHVQEKVIIVEIIFF